MLQGIRGGNSEALARLRGQHVGWARVGEVTIRQEAALHDAQFAVARENGFPSWTKLTVDVG